MKQETIIKNIRDMVDPLVGSCVAYAGKSHQVKSYTIHGERERVQIITDKATWDRNFESVIDFVRLLKPVTADKNPSPVAATVSDVKIFETSDYSIFKRITGNRQLNEKKIKRIIGDIQNGIDVLKYYPIQVSLSNTKLEVVDGQHRFHIAKKLKRPVHYIVLDQAMNLPDIAKVNSNVEKWKPKDFISCYVEQGNENYKKLEEFVKIYGFSWSLAMKLLSQGDPGSESGYKEHEAFSRGEFKVNFASEADTLASTCLRFNSFKDWRQRGFVIAIFRIMRAGKIDIEELIAKYEKFPDMLTKQTSYKEYLLTLELLYNKLRQSRFPIY